MKKNNEILKIVLAAIFLSLTFVLPFLTGQVPTIGAMLCPMHIPVILCGFICGWKYGLIVGFIAPLLRAFTLGMPPLYPTAICMALELATYGVLSGILYEILPKTKLNIFISLFVPMIIGRITWGTAMFVCMQINQEVFTLQLFWTSAIINSIPGIIIQIVVIPIIILLYENKLNRS